MATDPTTQSNHHSITTRHLSLEWTVDFEIKKIVGKAEYELERVGNGAVDEVMYVSFSCRRTC